MTADEDISDHSFDGGDFEAALGLNNLAAALSAAGIESVPGPP